MMDAPSTKGLGWPAIVLPRRADGEPRLDETERRGRRRALDGGSGECRAYARGAARGARGARRSASRGVESLQDPVGPGDGADTSLGSLMASRGSIVVVGLW